MKTKLFSSLLNLMYPNLCLSCGNSLMKHEQHICLKCIYDIPRTNYHLVPGNPVEKLFWGKVPVSQATSFSFFRKGSTFQKIIHDLKYKGNKEIGWILGKQAAGELSETDFFDAIEIIIPVPLHPRKQKERGYNQSEWIAKGITEVLEKPIDTENLIRIKENISQTSKTVYERHENTKEIFQLKNPQAFAGKHVLLVDDIITTGSTLEACIQALMNTENIKISIFTLAQAIN